MPCARILWQLGYPEKARKKIHQAFFLAQELSHPASQAFALGYAASYYSQPCREVQGVIEQTEALIELSSSQEGIALTYQGLADYQAAGSRIGQTY